MSLRVRLVLAAGLAVAVAVVAVTVSAYAGTRSALRAQLDQSLQNLTAQVLGSSGGSPAGRPDGRPGGGPVGGPPDADGDGGQGPGGDGGLALNRRGGPAFGGARGVVTLVRPNGSADTPAGETGIPVSPRFKTIAARGSGRYFTDMTVGGHAIRVLASGIGPAGALLVALPLSDINSALSRELLLLVIIAAAGIALAALLGVLVARAALAPIGRFTRQTEAIAAHPERIDEERLEVQGGDELARLAQTFNRTLEALQRSVHAQRNLVADASHELRTPIATIRANLQLMRDEALLSPEDRDALRRDVIEELDELTALVADVVELARGGRLSGEPSEVRVDEVVAAAVERALRRAPQLRIRPELEPTLVRGEGDRIARAVANLLDNATKYGGSDGAVDVTLHQGVLMVRDHGPGFHDEDLPFVFDRFHRARDARSQPGSGLGLAIVRQAADAHGGYAEAANAPEGGAVIRVSFGPGQAIAQTSPAGSGTA